MSGLCFPEAQLLPNKLHGTTRDFSATTHLEASSSCSPGTSRRWPISFFGGSYPWLNYSQRVVERQDAYRRPDAAPEFRR